MGLSTSKLRVAWKEYECAKDDMVIVSFGPDEIRVAPPTQAAWRALSAVMNHHGYQIRTADTDSYNCRTITGGTGKSLHSYGIALDINWTTNPYIKTPDRRKVRFSDKATQEERAQDVKRHLADTDMTPAMIDDVLAIRTTAGDPVFEWGGSWGKAKDAMHFEIDLSPGDLAAGIEWSAVNGTPDNAGNFEDNVNNAQARPMTTIPSAAFNIAHPFIAKWEGGFVDHPSDPGGATNLGITHHTLASWRGKPVTVQDVRDLTEAEAKQIFFARYWTPLHCDEMSVSLALMTYNAGVNSGPSRGGKLLQQALNEHGQDLAVDGAVGAKTIAAANSVDERSAVESYARAHENFYRGLRTFGTFGRGWLNRLSDVKNGALNLVGRAPAPSTGETTMPAPDPAPAAGQPGDNTNLVATLTQVAQLIQTIQQARMPNAQPAAPNPPAADIGTILAAVLQLTGQMNGSVSPTPVSTPEPPQPAEPPLTPVNNALGPGLGRLLNGRKTQIGTLGLLATTLLPIFFPPLAPLASVVSAVGGAVADAGTTVGAASADATPTAGTMMMSVLQPLFGALAGWGVMGKLDKWADKAGS